MDGIGLAASLMTVVGLAWKSVELLQNIQHGDKTRIQLLEEVTTIWLALQRLKQNFDPPPATINEPWMKPLVVLAEPNGILQQIREELEKLTTKLTTSSSRLGKLATSLRWPFEEKETLETIHRISRLKESAILLMSQSIHGMNQDILGHAKSASAIAVQNYFQQVLQWLSPLNFLQKQEEVLGAADSYTWVLESNLFKAWHNGDVRSMWCYGAPGAGKSVLAASMFAELTRMHESENVAVVVTFCSFDNEDSQSPKLIAASILKQILQKRGDGRVPPELKEWYTRSTMSKDGVKPDLQFLVDVLRSELGFFDTVFVLLDGLDEVGSIADRAAMIKTIHSFGPSIRVMITSRHSEDILESLEEELSGEDTKSTQWGSIQYKPLKQDIGKYVSRRLESEPDLNNLVGGDDGFRQNIIETVVEKSEDVFLLARLHVDSLADCLTVRQLHRTLERLLPDLEKTYLEAFERMKRPLSTARQVALQRLLLWVAWVERPLSVAEMEHALAITPEVKAITADDIQPIREITGWTAGLIFVDAKNLVRVIHPTAGRFFYQHREKLFPDGDSIIAHACLDYLGMPSLRTTLSGPDRHSQFRLRIGQHPFLEYVVLHSAAHIERTRPTDDDNRLMAFLTPKTRLAFLQALYFLDHHWSTETDASALHIAAYMGLTHVISALVEAGENVDSRDPFGSTPLMYAASRGDVGAAAVDRLLSVGANPALKSKTGYTALLGAIEAYGELAVARLLEEPDVNINAVPEGSTGLDRPALMASINLYSETIFTRLIARKDVDIYQHARGTNGMTALHFATRDGMVWAVKGLVSRDSSQIDVGDLDGWPPLFYAAANGFVDAIDILVEHGSDVNYLDGSRGSALMRAADYDQGEAVQHLLKLGSNARQRDFLGRTAIHSAAINGSWNALDCLLNHENSPDVNAQGADGVTALHDACHWDYPEGIQILINAGARVDIRNKDGRTPLDVARANRNDSIVDVLKTATGYANIAETRLTKTLAEAVITDPSDVLAKRIAAASLSELNTINAFNGTPLFIACFHGRADVVLMLLNAGSNPDLTNKFNRGPLFAAIERCSLEAVKALIAHGVNMNATPHHDTHLWESALEEDAADLVDLDDSDAESTSFPDSGLRGPTQREDIALALLENGAEIRNQSKYLQRALHAAVKRDNVAVARRLVAAGASIHLKTEGKTAIDLAEKYEAENMLEYFRELGDALAEVDQNSPEAGVDEKSGDGLPDGGSASQSASPEEDQSSTEIADALDNLNVPRLALVGFLVLFLAIFLERRQRQQQEEMARV